MWDVFLGDYFFGLVQNVSVHAHSRKYGQTHWIPVPEEVISIPARYNYLSEHPFEDKGHFLNFPESAIVWRDEETASHYYLMISRDYKFEAYLKTCFLLRSRISKQTNTPQNCTPLIFVTAFFLLLAKIQSVVTYVPFPIADFSSCGPKPECYHQTSTQ